MYPLFEPFSLGRLQLRNRLVMAPMTRGRAENGVPTSLMAEYYRRRAAGGLGLIITEGTLIDHPLANAYGDVPYLRPDTVEAWRAVNHAIHAEGCASVVQVWHCGPESRPDIAAFSVMEGGEEVVRVATRADELDLLERYRCAAGLAVESGFDGLELHGAHGYLLDSYLRSSRREFVHEVVRATRETVGPDFPILFRFSTWRVGGYDDSYIHSPEELKALVLPLRDAGVDLLHASVRRYWEPVFEGSELSYAGWARRVSGLPSMVVGSIGLEPAAFAGSGPDGVDALRSRLAAGEFDLVAVGRALLTEPEWANKVRYTRLDAIAPWYQGARDEVYP